MRSRRGVVSVGMVTVVINEKAIAKDGSSGPSEGISCSSGSIGEFGRVSSADLPDLPDYLLSIVLTK